MNRLAVGRSARAQQAHKVDNRIDLLHKVDNRFDRLRALHKIDTDTQTTVVSVENVRVKTSREMTSLMSSGTEDSRDAECFHSF